jgi:2-polyprenyl-3-methyl-5-hydroxy-6-metoxy-1,4-benzoquinol methylase
MSITAEPITDEGVAEAKAVLTGQLVAAATGALEIATLRIGLDLGLFAALRSNPATPGELAERAGIHVRYAQEWLEQQYASTMIEVDDVAAAPQERRFSLPEAHAQVLLDGDDPVFLGPVVDMTSSWVAAGPAVAEAFRSGGGVSFAEYGGGTRHGIGAVNRGIFLNSLPEWIGLAGIPARFAGIGHPKVADVGCGIGWSSVVLGQELPSASIVGVDLDPASVEEARENVRAEGRSAQIAIRRADAAALDGGPFDLVTVFQMLHDAADPVGVLSAARAALAPGGEVLIADEATADEFGTARGDLIERFQYGASVLHCLPATMAEDPVEATGTVIRPSTIRRYAAEAGFTSVEELPVTPGFFRVYRLR